MPVHHVHHGWKDEWAPVTRMAPEYKKKKDERIPHVTARHKPPPDMERASSGEEGAG